jgi:predicted ribosome quality control (RQC) complex YloA/Tae2 family protein
VDEDRLREVAEELYGLRPEEFTGARSAAEKQARADGDRELASAVKALRRPAVAAWAVNLLGRHRSELLTQVVSLGDSLRQAQSQLQGDELRELTRQRRRLVAAVTAEARAVAESEGQRLSDAAVRQVEETLQAAMANPEAAQAVLSGLLAQPLSSTGVESLTGEALAVPLGTRRPPAAPEPERPTLTVVRDDGRELREAEERAAEADDTLRRAAKVRDSLEKKRAKAEAKLLQLEAELEELRRKVAEAEEATEAAAAKLARHEASLEDAEAEVESAQSVAREAAVEVDRLRG